MPKVSAVVNTRNEENNLRHCLTTLSWCDEIVVVDMESEDNTVAIAREFTDKVFHHPKVLAFDIARKFAVEQAAGEWILLIDADELVPKDLAERLLNIGRQDEADAVYIPYKNYLLGEWNKYTGWWPDHHCRYFKKDVMTFSERIHAYQSLDTSARKLYLPSEERYAVHHFAYRDVNQFIEKLNRYTTIEAAHLFQEGRSFSYKILFRSAVEEFVGRYLKLKGYKDGTRGLFVSLMMTMYRLLTHMKLWEMHEFKNEAVSVKYERLKQELVMAHQRPSENELLR